MTDETQSGSKRQRQTKTGFQKSVFWFWEGGGGVKGVGVLVTQPEGLPMMWSVSLSLIRVQDSIGASGLHSSLWSRWLRSSKPRRQTEINAETPFKCKLTAESRSAGNSDSSASNWSVSWQEKKNMFVSSSSASGTSLNKLKSEPGSDLWSIFWSLTDQRWSERHNLFLLLGFLNVLDSADDRVVL